MITKFHGTYIDLSEIAIISSVGNCSQFDIVLKSGHTESFSEPAPNIPSNMESYKLTHKDLVDLWKSFKEGEALKSTQQLRALQKIARRISLTPEV